MPENEQKNGFLFYDLKEILFEVLRLKYIIIAIIVLSVAVSFVYTKMFCNPKYTAVSKVHILDNQSAQENTSEYSISTYLTRDYTILVTERIVLDEVIKKLDLKMSYQSLKNCVSTENPENSRIIEVWVTTGDAKLSKQIANSICTVSKEVMSDLLGSDRVNIVSAAEKPKSPSSPNTQMNLMIGLLFGIIASFAVVALSHYRNDKINGAEDVQKYLGLCTLATIPYNAKSGRGDAKRRKVKS